VRELKNALEGSVVLCRDGTLHKSDLSLSGLPDAPQKSQAATGDTSSLSLDQSERNAILRALQQAGFVQKKAAHLLGISRRAIHYKIKKYGIDCGKRSSIGREGD
jgi:DNA-binding NtrC family response regulator